MLRAACVRGAWLLGGWWVLIGAHPGDLLCGLFAAALATGLSLLLLPPGNLRLHPGAALWLALRFVGQSVVAGVDVARRAFDPRLPLRPGFVSVSPRIPPGPARNAFASLTSLLPGTLPVADDGDVLLYHCLDVAQPVATQLAAEEAAFCRVLGTGSGETLTR